MIQVQEMLRQMETLDHYGRPQPFSVVVCTHDTQRKTGGRILHLENMILARLDKPAPAPGAPRRLRKTSAPQKPRSSAPDPQTRTLYNPISQEKITVNIRLITRYNNIIVID